MLWDFDKFSFFTFLEVNFVYFLFVGLGVALLGFIRGYINGVMTWDSKEVADDGLAVDS